MHAISFTRSTLGGSAKAIFTILPTNLGVALLVIAAAVVGEDWGWVCWAGAVAVLVLSVLRGNESGFSIRAEHFADRHALIVIIALGETIIATGKGTQGHLGQASTVAAVLAAMALVSALWWAYFGGDEEQALGALNATPAERRTRVALRSYSLSHLLALAPAPCRWPGAHRRRAARRHARSHARARHPDGGDDGRRRGDVPAWRKRLPRQPAARLDHAVADRRGGRRGDGGVGGSFVGPPAARGAGPRCGANGGRLVVRRTSYVDRTPATAAP
ncbi:MAG: low temperature requirement protein A [Nocardioidaceae bacterium]